MKNNVKFYKKLMVVAAFAPAVLFSSYSHGVNLPSFSDLASNAYFGTEFGMKHVGVKSGAHSDLYGSTHKMGRYIMATQLTPNIDAEVYIERNIGHTKKSNGGGHSSVRFSNAGLGLIYKFNLSGMDTVKPFVGIGLKNVRVKIDHNRVVDLYLTKSKVLWKLNGGLELMFNEHVGTRFTTSFENSSRLKPSSHGHRVRLKDSFGTGVTLLAKLC